MPHHPLPCIGSFCTVPEQELLYGPPLAPPADDRMRGAQCSTFSKQLDFFTLVRSRWIITRGGARPSHTKSPREFTRLPAAAEHSPYVDLLESGPVLGPWCFHLRLDETFWACLGALLFRCYSERLGGCCRSEVNLGFCFDWTPVRSEAHWSFGSSFSSITLRMKYEFRYPSKSWN